MVHMGHWVNVSSQWIVLGPNVDAFQGHSFVDVFVVGAQNCYYPCCCDALGV